MADSQDHNIWGKLATRIAPTLVTAILKSFLLVLTVSHRFNEQDTPQNSLIFFCAEEESHEPWRLSASPSTTLFDLKPQGLTPQTHKMHVTKLATLL